MKDEMTTISIADALKFPEGTPIPRILGTMTHVFDRKTGEGDFGPYSSQSGVIEEDGSKILFTVWNKPAIPEDYKGRVVIFRSGTGKKPSMTLKSDFKDASKRTLNVTKSCFVLTEDEENDDIPYDSHQVVTVKPTDTSKPQQNAPQANVEPKKAIVDGSNHVRQRLMQYANLRIYADKAATVACPDLQGSDLKDVGTSFWIQGLREGLEKFLPSNKPIEDKPTSKKTEEEEPEFLPAEEF